MPTLTDFVKQYYGQPNVGDTDANKGQCVGLIEVWTDALGLPHTWGNAKDLLNDADTNSFEVVQNDPSSLTQFPVPGDVFVFGASYGAGAGHTGVVVNANGSLVSLFEQNDGLDSGVPQLKTYNYGGSLGWLHPKNVVIDDQAVIDQLRTERDANYNNYQAEIQKNADLTTQLTNKGNELQALQQEFDAYKASHPDVPPQPQPNPQPPVDPTPPAPQQGFWSALRDLIKKWIGL